MTATARIAPEGRLGGTPLAGRHAVVTGAARGIGAAIAATLAGLGASVT
ncbi:MAG: short chain dehydrogenase, partial [Alphaproteobacteria bacterium]|nr:short chain dehydrogenase [Alphaproteobacteria bacterium]